METLARILVDDSLNRFMKGEVGAVRENDCEKYDYLIELTPKYIPPKHRHGFLKGVTTMARRYYFYENEVSIIKTNRDDKINSLDTRHRVR